MGIVCVFGLLCFILKCMQLAFGVKNEKIKAHLCCILKTPKSDDQINK